MIFGTIWEILGIEATDNKKAIKRAYAKQSAIYHPEDNPEQFKKIQEAYQQALAYAGNQTNQEETQLHISKLPKQKVNEIVIDVDFDKYRQQNQSTDNPTVSFDFRDIKDQDLELKKKDNSIDIDFKDIKDEDLELKKRNSIDIDFKNIEDEDLELKKIDNSIDINLKDIREENLKTEKANNLFNVNFEQQETSNEDYTEYLLERINNQLQKDPSVEILSSLFGDVLILRALDDQDFKECFEKIILKYQKDYSEEALEYLYREASYFEFTKIKGQMRWTKQRKQKIGTRIFGVILVIFIVCNMMINKSKNNPPVSEINYQETIDNNKDLINNLKDSLFSSNYEMNKVYLNEVNIIDEENKYWLSDEEGNYLLERPIDKVQFTYSNVLILKIDNDYYLYDTQSRIFDERGYSNIYLLEVSDLKKGEKGKRLLINVDGAWKLRDLSGQEELTIDSNISIPSMPTNVEIDENGIITIT